ncbi:MAG: hypothetical protein VBE63_21540 [Lamprobacter sp.]|nr:hypothetical protein [Lamprobacter sp.]
MIQAPVGSKQYPATTVGTAMTAIEIRATLNLGLWQGLLAIR